jgi:hypothetical protein
MISHLAFRTAVLGGWKPLKREVVFAGSNMGLMEKGGKPTLNGWSLWDYVNEPDKGSSECVPHKDTILDPLFWQALGKRLGWSDVDSLTGIPMWREYAGQFFDLVLTDGDVEMFWGQNLVSQV